MTWTNFKSDLRERLRDPAYAALYLQAAREEDGDEGFKLAMREVLLANGGMTKVARDTRRGRTSLYKSFSKKGNPSLDVVTQALEAAGLSLRVVPKQARETNGCERVPHPLGERRAREAKAVPHRRRDYKRVMEVKR